MTIKQLQREVYKSQLGMPTLSEWINRISAINFPGLSDALAGFYCGRDGETRDEIPGIGRYLVMQWYNGKVETAYVS